LLVDSRFDHSPLRHGHARTVHVDAGTDSGIGTDPDYDASPGHNSDGDSGATADADIDGGGASRRIRRFPVTLGKHQLHAIHSRR
jgi:hypothetical protein